MNLVFCGTPEFAVPTLRRLLAEKFPILAVITQPDRPRGRGLKLASPPIKEVTLEAGIHLYQPERIKHESARRFLEQMKPDAVVIIAYGQIIPADLLGLPKFGWINLHASLLPKYRGAAPINWAMIEGETVTGVTTMRIDAGLDTGPILLQRECPIVHDDTAISLEQKLAEMGADLMVETLRGLEAGQIAPRPQDHSRATLAPLLKKEVGRIDWSEPAQRISNCVRALVPWPRTFTSFRGETLHIEGARTAPPPQKFEAAAEPGTLRAEKHRLLAACGQQTWLEILEVQPQDRKRMSARDFVNGFHVRSGEQFT